jgi:hypothetical protein
MQDVQSFCESADDEVLVCGDLRVFLFELLLVKELGWLLLLNLLLMKDRV